MADANIEKMDVANTTDNVDKTAEAELPPIDTIKQEIVDAVETAVEPENNTIVEGDTAAAAVADKTPNESPDETTKTDNKETSDSASNAMETEQHEDSQPDSVHDEKQVGLLIGLSIRKKRLDRCTVLTFKEFSMSQLLSGRFLIIQNQTKYSRHVIII